MPFRTAARRIRLSASETHCPASPRVTSALRGQWVNIMMEHMQAKRHQPLPLHALNDCCLIVPI